MCETRLPDKMKFVTTGLRGRALLIAGLLGLLPVCPAATYVVEQGASARTDHNSGAAEQLFRTIQGAADAAKPGDTVFVLPGHYHERVRVRTSGGADQPITFRAVPRRSAVVSGFELHGNYTHVEGF